MKKLLKTMLVFIMVAVAVSCSDEEATVTPVKEDNIKTDTKISIEQARQDLLGLLADIDSERSRSYGKLPRTIKEAHSFKFGDNESRSEETPNYYVFNFDNNQGYAIMSGDERMPSLIALTDSGSFNENDSFDNPGLDIFYAKLDTGKIVITPIEPGGDGCINWGDSTYLHYMDWENTVYKDNGYCSVKWGQDFPYNTYTFTNDGKYAKTGCVATAVAQLMAVYKFPETYSGYNFLWDEMIWSPYADMCTARSRDMIAYLMQLLGAPYNLSTTYGVTESNAPLVNVNRTLTHFGYSNGGTIGTYSTNNIESEISTGNPVLVYGNDKENDSNGHLWLVHGFLVRKRIVETRDLKTKKTISTTTEIHKYVLCNWGYEGIHDGYYLSGLFDLKKGPEFKDDMSHPGLDSGAASNDNMNYKYDLMTITGIRK